MKLIQNLYSRTGEFRNKELEVTKIQKMDNVLLKFTKHSHVIWANGKHYPIIFRSADLRDKVYDNLNVMLVAKVETYTIRLEDFYTNKISLDQFKTLLTSDSYTLPKYLFGICQQLMIEKSCEFKELQFLHAFENLSMNQFKAIQTKTKQSFTDVQIQTFSKTLRYPKKFHDVVTPYTFWNTLNKL